MQHSATRLHIFFFRFEPLSTWLWAAQQLGAEVKTFRLAIIVGGLTLAGLIAVAGAAFVGTN